MDAAVAPVAVVDVAVAVVAASVVAGELGKRPQLDLRHNLLRF